MTWKEFTWIVAAAAAASIFIRLFMANLPTVAASAGLPTGR